MGQVGRGGNGGAAAIGTWVLLLLLAGVASGCRSAPGPGSHGPELPLAQPPLPLFASAARKPVAS